MRVMIVNRYASTAGGAEQHAVGLARALRARGHEVRFLSTTSEANAEQEGAFIPPTGGDFWRSAPPPRDRLRVAASALWNRQAAAATRALVERFQPGVCHLHDLYPQLSAAPALVAARHGVPIVQTLHNYELISASALDHRGGAVDRSDAPGSVRALRSLLHVTRRRLHVPYVGSWIAVSRFVANVYAQHGIEAQALPNFCQPSVRRAPLGFDDRRGVLFAGRLTAPKGTTDVIALADRLPAVPMTVAGWGPLAEEVRAAADRLENLDFAGFLDREALATRLSTARLLVVPSRWQEPAGLVALEAMAEGTPVIAYESGGLSEYVRDAGAGRVIQPSIERLAAETAALHGDREAWGKMSAHGPAATATTHSPDRYVDALEPLYAAASTVDPDGARLSGSIRW